MIAGRNLSRAVALNLDRFRRRGPAGIAWALRLTAAAVASYLVASAIFPNTRPLLAPLTALLVVQFTPINLLVTGVERVLSVVAGVSLAVGFSTIVPLAWWSLGLLIAVSILIGQALRLGSNLIEVPISAMLVLGVGSLSAESAGWQRITETLVGAAVGVILNLLLPSKIGADDAGNAIKDLADELSRLLRRAADEIDDPDVSAAAVADRTTGWLDEVRHTTHDIPRVGAALLRAEQGRRLNVRAIGTANAGPGLRQGMEALEHSAIAVRGMVREVHDATVDPQWPRDEMGDDEIRGLVQLFREIADGLAAFGDLVRAEARPQRQSRQSEIERVQLALDGLHGARARLTDLLRAENTPVVSELRFSLLSTVKRLLRELDLGERIQRQALLQPPPPPILTRASRRRVRGASSDGQ